MYCGGIPTKILKYDVSDGDGKGQVLEYLCDSCFERWIEKGLTKRLDNMNFG